MALKGSAPQVIKAESSKSYARKHPLDSEQKSQRGHRLHKQLDGH